MGLPATPELLAAIRAAGIDPDTGRPAAPGPPAAAAPEEPAPTKYRARATWYRGVRYDSRAEARRAETLDLMEAGGLIAWWIGQPVFRLGCPENRYRADFLVVEQGGILVHVEDVKGYETPKFRHDRELWLAYGPCELWLFQGRGGRSVEVIPGGAAR